MSAIVADPVPNWAGPDVVCCISLLLGYRGAILPAVPGQAAATCAELSCSTLAKKSVLSILPWKIGTPSSMHFSMTSRRSMFASRASSVGVRWFAISTSPPGEVCHVKGHGSAFTGRPQRGSCQSELNIRSDRVGKVGEHVLDSETLGQQIAERADPEGFRCIVACGHE